MTDQEIIEAGLMTEEELIADNLAVEEYRLQVLQANFEAAVLQSMENHEKLMFEFHMLSMQCKDF